MLKFEEPEAHGIVTQRGNGRDAVFAKLVHADVRYDRVGHFPQNIKTWFVQHCKLEACKRRCKCAGKVEFTSASTRRAIVFSSFITTR